MNEFTASLMSDTKIRTGKVRVSYEHLCEPASVNDSEPKYSACVLIPKEDTQCIETLELAVEHAKKKGIEKYGKAFAGPKMRSPIHDGDVEKAGDPAYAGMWYVNITSREKPQIVGPDRRPITDPSEIYSGIWGRFTMNAYPYNRSGSGISFGLLNFQKLEDDEPLGGFRSSAAADFGDPDDDDWL